MVHMQANGVQAYLTTLVLFFLGWQLQLFSPARVYDLFGEILSALNIFSLFFCAFLYFKARTLHCHAFPETSNPSSHLQSHSLPLRTCFQQDGLSCSGHAVK